MNKCNAYYSYETFEKELLHYINEEWASKVDKAILEILIKEINKPKKKHK